jgi:hypothetical protein
MIAPALAKRGYRVSMICYDYGQPDGIEQNGVTILNMHKPDEGIPVVRYFHPRLTSLWRALGRADADIYYQRTAAAYTGFVSAFCRKNGRKAIYAGASDVDFIPGKQEIRYARDRLIFEHGLRRVDKVITQNPQQHQELRTHYGREGTLIPSCYSPPPGATNDRAGYVLWVASLGRRSARSWPSRSRRLRAQARRDRRPGSDRPAEYFRALQEAADRAEGLRAARRDRALLQQGARVPQHVRVRRLPEHVPAGVVARHPERGIHRHRIAPPGRTGLRLRGRGLAGHLEARSPDA